MTQAQHPMFEGRPIQDGDTGTIKVTFAGVYPDGTLRVLANVLGTDRFAAIAIESVVSHTPAPRPLVPGPAVFRLANGQDKPCTVIGVDGGWAWVRWESGERDEEMAMLYFAYPDDSTPAGATSSFAVCTMQKSPKWICSLRNTNLSMATCRRGF